MFPDGDKWGPRFKKHLSCPAGGLTDVEKPLSSEVLSNSANWTQEQTVNASLEDQGEVPPKCPPESPPKMYRKLQFLYLSFSQVLTSQ